MNLYIVIPAYNEAKKIGFVIQSLKEHGYNNILVVDDGSLDETKKVALESGAEVINHVINRGQGAALRTGIEFIRENYNPDVIVTFDADGQHKVEDIEYFVSPIINGEADITLGSRFLNNKSNIPPLRKFTLKLGVIFTNIISNINLTDTHNGFRALGKKAFNSIKITQRGMEHASEIIDEIKKNHLRYKEIPTEIIYSDYSKSKGQKTSDFIKLGIKFIIKKITE